MEGRGTDGGGVRGGRRQSQLGAHIAVWDCVSAYCVVGLCVASRVRACVALSQVTMPQVVHSPDSDVRVQPPTRDHPASTSRDPLRPDFALVHDYNSTQLQK